MKRKIYRGMHYSLSFLNFKPVINKKHYYFRYNVKFYPSCRYNIGEDQSDINKLFGLSFGFHHNQSERIGWRYDRITDKIELLLYTYHIPKKGEKSVRTSKSLCFVDINKEIDIKFTVDINNNYRNTQVEIYDQRVVLNINKPHQNTLWNWGYTLGLYFGGNKKAPKTMIIDIENHQ